MTKIIIRTQLLIYFFREIERNKKNENLNIERLKNLNVSRAFSSGVVENLFKKLVRKK